jgi:hypothetical protein
MDLIQRLLQRLSMQSAEGPRGLCARFSVCEEHIVWNVVALPGRRP